MITLGAEFLAYDLQSEPKSLPCLRNSGRKDGNIYITGIDVDYTGHDGLLVTHITFVNKLRPMIPVNIILPVKETAFYEATIADLDQITEDVPRQSRQACLHLADPNETPECQPLLVVHEGQTKERILISPVADKLVAVCLPQNSAGYSLHTFNPGDTLYFDKLETSKGNRLVARTAFAA